VIGESMLAKRVAAAGNTFCRWARGWLAAATRWPTRPQRARTLERSAVVCPLSQTIGRSRRTSVRTTSARTQASKRSSLFPADPYRLRRFLTCPGGITNTVSPAASSVSTTGPSPRSMPTCPAPARSSRAAIHFSPAASCVTVNRPTTSPSAPTMQTAWSSLAQSTPAVTRIVTAHGSILMVVSSPLPQWEDTRWSRDTAAGRSLIGAHWRIAL
jgi:hypothetical protein